jgi:hypothetical protein
VSTLPLIALLDKVSDMDGVVMDDAAAPIGVKTSDKVIVVPVK